MVPAASDGSQSMAMIWPPGYSKITGRGSFTEIVAPSGAVVARMGESVSFGGGSAPAQALHSTNPCLPAPEMSHG